MMPGMDPRQMAMMMKRMGVEMADIEGVEEVVVRTKDAEYRFRKAQVSVIRAQGSETWQIVGKPERSLRGAPSPQPTTAAAPAPTPPAMPAPTPAPTKPAAPVSADDVKLVMAQTGRNERESRAALETTNGDLAEAILRLEKR